MGVRSLASLEGYTSRTMIVLGTGLSTTGLMNFRNNLLSAEPKAIVELLDEKNSIPDFTGINVVWQHIGDVLEPQQSLTQSQCVKLQEIWESIVTQGGGTFTYNSSLPKPMDADADYPSVSVVELPEDAPIDLKDFDLSGDAWVLDEPVIVNEDQVTFVQDSADYLTPEIAVETLKPFAECLLKHESVSILLAGTTAGDEDSDYTFSLSKERADAVKRTLVELGVDADRILTIGLGSSDPWHVSGAGYEGSIASENRKVVIMDASTDQARELLK